VPDLLSAIDVSPIILIALGVLALLGIGFLALVIWVYIEDRVQSGKLSDKFDFAPGPHDGAAVPDYVNETALRNLAAHHQLEDVPCQVQEKKGAKIGGGAPKGVLTGEQSHETTVTLEPHDDLGELVRKVGRHLHETNELNESIDLIWIEDIMVEAIPDFAEPDRAQSAFQDWLEENYPKGFDGVTATQLAEELARLGELLPQKKICERLRSSFEGIVENAAETPLFLEGEWAVSDDDKGVITLNKTNLRVESPTPSGAAVRSIPMPDGASIKMTLLESELTEHGKRRMVGVSRPIRARVLATLKQYNPDSGCFELVPIAVYQRVGSK